MWTRNVRVTILFLFFLVAAHHLRRFQCLSLFFCYGSRCFNHRKASSLVSWLIRHLFEWDICVSVRIRWESGVGGRLGVCFETMRWAHVRIWNFYWGLLSCYMLSLYGWVGTLALVSHKSSYKERHVFAFTSTALVRRFKMVLLHNIDSSRSKVDIWESSQRNLAVPQNCSLFAPHTHFPATCLWLGIRMRGYYWWLSETGYQ